jgi:hypothetical protein
MSFISILSFTAHQSCKERAATDWLDRCDDVTGTSPNQPGWRTIAVMLTRAAKRKMMLTCKSEDSRYCSSSASITSRQTDSLEMRIGADPARSLVRLNLLITS